MKTEEEYARKALLPGTMLNGGKYRIERVLGSGGFGITYLAKWIQIQNTGLKSIVTGEITVVVKEFYHSVYCYRNEISQEILINNKDQQREFDRLKRKLLSEARILNTFTHPNIVEVFDVFEENNTTYITMKYIDGSDLESKIKQQGALPVDVTLKYFIQLASALQEVHRYHILHLDISPGNVLIDKNDNALLIDFGISLSYDNAGDVKLTSKLLSGKKKGFSPPEQYSMEILKKFDPSIDVYALGATLYNCLSGKEPPEAFSLLSGDDSLQLLNSLNPAVSPFLEKLVRKAMSLNRKDRHQNMGDLLEELKMEEEVCKKGKAKELLGKAKELRQKELFSSALDCYNEVLSILPDNKECRKGIITCRKALEALEIKENRGDSNPKTALIAHPESREGKNISENPPGKREKKVLPKTEILDQSAHTPQKPKTRTESTKGITGSKSLLAILIPVLLSGIILVYYWGHASQTPEPKAEPVAVIDPEVKEPDSNNDATDETKGESGTSESQPPSQPAEEKIEKSTAPKVDYLQQGNRFFNRGDYSAAIDSYKKYISSVDFETPSVSDRIKDSEKYLTILKEADSYFSEGKYEEAKKEYGKVLIANQGDKYAKKQIQQCNEHLMKKSKEE